MREVVFAAMTTTLEQIRIGEGDTVSFAIKSGNMLTGTVIDASDPAKLRVRLDSGIEVYVGRGAVEAING